MTARRGLGRSRSGPPGGDRRRTPRGRGSLALRGAQPAFSGPIIAGAGPSSERREGGGDRLDVGSIAGPGGGETLEARGHERGGQDRDTDEVVV